MINRDNFIFFSHRGHFEPVNDLQILNNPDKYRMGDLFINVAMTNLFFKVNVELVERLENIDSMIFPINLKSYNDEYDMIDDYEPIDVLDENGFFTKIGGIAVCNSYSDYIRMMIIEDILVETNNDIAAMSADCNYMSQDFVIVKYSDKSVKKLKPITIHDLIYNELNFDFRVIRADWRQVVARNMSYIITNNSYRRGIMSDTSVFNQGSMILTPGHRDNIFIMITADAYEPIKYIDTLSFTSNIKLVSNEEIPVYVDNLTHPIKYDLTNYAEIVSYCIYGSLQTIVCKMMQDAVNHDTETDTQIFVHMENIKLMTKGNDASIRMITMTSFAEFFTEYIGYGGFLIPSL